VPAGERRALEGVVRPEVRWIGSAHAEHQGGAARGGDGDRTNESVMAGHVLLTSG